MTEHAVLDGIDFDGALAWSYPPAPGASERFKVVAYEGCRDCGGRGLVLDPSASKYARCNRCFRRFIGHPLRQWYYRRRDMIKRAEDTLMREALVVASAFDGLGMASEGEDLFKELSHLIHHRAEMLRSVLGAMTERRRGAYRRLAQLGKGNGNKPH